MALRIAGFFWGGEGGRGETIKKALWLFIVYKKKQKSKTIKSQTPVIFSIFMFSQ